MVPDDGDLPKVKFDFKTIADIENIEVGKILDVVGKKVAWGNYLMLLSDFKTSLKRYGKESRFEILIDLCKSRRKQQAISNSLINRKQ